MMRFRSRIRIRIGSRLRRLNYGVDGGAPVNALQRASLPACTFGTCGAGEGVPPFNPAD